MKYYKVYEFGVFHGIVMGKDEELAVNSWLITRGVAELPSALQNKFKDSLNLTETTILV